MEIRENIPLAPYTNFRVGGPAKFFVEAKSADDVKEAVAYARERGLPFYVLGGGMNVLASDKGFPGLVIRIAMKNLAIDGETIVADAGCTMGQVVAAAQKEGLTGFEWAAGLPGTVGGAVFGNAGCFGGEVKGCVGAVAILDPKTGTIHMRDGAELGLGYRHSRLKESGEVVLAATLRLAKGDAAEIARAAAAVREKAEARIREQPLGAHTAGSTFKGVPVTDAVRKRLEGSDTLWQEGMNRAGFLSAGWLLEQAGLKGHAVGGARFSEKHANFIITGDGATAADISMLIREGKHRVRERFGIELEEEIRYIGF